MGCSASSNSQFKQGFHETYNLCEKMGSGAFGCVFKARLRDQHNPNYRQKYAAKILDKKAPDGPRPFQVRKDFQFEVTMLEKVKGSRNVVAFIEAFEDSRFCYVIMECCGPTVLEAFLETDANENDLAKVFHGMTQGVLHCHSVNILHRDIKPLNFLISRGSMLNDKDCVVKLCDLGFAVEMPKEGAKGLTQICGTAPFMAPEMVKEQEYDFKVDVWSLGVSAYMMLFGTFPYNPPKPNAHQMKQLVKEGKTKPSFEAADTLQQPSSHACEFVRTLLERAPRKRPTAAEVLAMPYLRDCIIEDVEKIEAGEPGTPMQDFFRKRSRMCSLAGNVAKAGQIAREVQEERAISPKALKIFEEELHKLQEKTGLRRPSSTRTMTLPSTPSSTSIRTSSSSNGTAGSTQYMTKTSPTSQPPEMPVYDEDFAHKKSVDSQESRPGKRHHTYPIGGEPCSSSSSLVQTEEGKLLMELRGA